MAPKKRVRPPKAHDAETNEDATETQPRKRMRGNEASELQSRHQTTEGSKKSKQDKPSADRPRQSTERNGQDQAEVQSRRSRRARRPEDDNQEQSPSEEPRSKEQVNKPKPKSAQNPAPPDKSAAEGHDVEDGSTRRSRRERRSADDNPWWSANKVSPQTAVAVKGPEGPSKKKRGPGGPSPNSQGGSGPGKPQAKNKQQPQAEPEARGERAQRRHVNAAAPPSMPDLDPAQQAGPAAEYRHLTSRTRQIPRSIIDSKWTPLDPASISVVDSLVADAARPVLLRLRDRDQRHAQAQTILHTFATRLRTKLVKGMPFPPPTIPAAQAPSSRKTTRKRAQSGRSGYEAELDFEKTVDAIASLERALDPLLHSVVLLKAEKEREERELEREYKLLRQLEANAKAERMGWRERRKRSHVLAGGLAGAGEKGGEGGLGLEVVKRQEGKGGAGGVFKDLQEEELLALSQQIGSHMESMRSNLAQIDGVLPAIAKTKAALQGALCQYMDPVQYDQVVLGKDIAKDDRRLFGCTG